MTSKRHLDRAAYKEFKKLFKFFVSHAVKKLFPPVFSSSLPPWDGNLDFATPDADLDGVAMIELLQPKFHYLPDLRYPLVGLTSS